MRRCVTLALALIVVLGASASGADERSGDAVLAEYFKTETARLRDACLAEVDSLADWEAKKPELRRQLFEMLGLDPLPEKTPLNPVVTGTTELDGIVVERLHFESRPGLYVTANFYRPKEQAGPLPAVLYVCGHSTQKKDGVSFGNKAGYHHHGAWFARNGYVCLTIDTLQLGEIEGIHHGTYRYDRWWWNSRGYTPAGVEAWNGIRAVDYLQSRPEVDDEKIGVTGRSGGGAYSWFIAALDERIKAAVPVAGITDLENHVVDGCVEGHCDCMFFVNTYRWDYPQMAALVAPRPLLISNTDKDRIFPLDGVVRTHALVRKVYEFYDAEKKLGLNITEGPHKDTQELRVHAFVWFDRFLKGEERVIDDPAEKFLEPEQLKVFASLPGDEINTRVDEVFMPKAPGPNVPETSEDWAALRDGWMTGLRDKTFRGWPDEKSGAVLQERNELQRDGFVVRRFDVVVLDRDGRRLASRRRAPSTEEPFHVPLVVAWRKGTERPSVVRMHIVGPELWEKVRYSFGLKSPSQPIEIIEGDSFADLKQHLKSSGEAVAFLAPRGIGPTAWTGDAKEQTHIRRRFMLLGQTLDGMRVLDVRRAIQGLRAAASFQETPISLHGSGDAAVHALYASLFEPHIERIELTDLPASHDEGPDLLNVLRILDVPQTVALAAERCPVVLHTAEPEAWSYPKSVAGKLGWGSGRVQVIATETAASQ